MPTIGLFIHQNQKKTVRHIIYVIGQSLLEIVWKRFLLSPAAKEQAEDEADGC